MKRTLSLAVTTALSTSFLVFAKAQTASPLPMASATQIDAPLRDVSEVVDELRSVSYHRADGQRTFAVVAEDFAKYFPTAVSEGADGPAIDPGAMAAILLALVKDAHAANEHLNSQLEHVISDKAQVERRLHSLEAEIAELQQGLDARLLSDNSRKRKGRGAAARN